MGNPDRALVLETERRQALVALRNLAKNGVEVVAGSSERVNPGGLSRYAADSIRYPAPREDEAAFLDALEAELQQREYAMVLPATDVTVVPVVENRERLAAHTTLPYPSFETLRMGIDKQLTVAAARETGVEIPTTLAPAALDTDRVADEVGFPLVVKPRVAAGRSGVVVCDSEAELEQAYPRLRERHGPLLVQEFIPNGGEVGVYTMYDRSSRLAGATVQRRLRSNPPEGGPSTLRETVDRPELVERADTLLSSMDWQGVAMVEFRIDERTAEPMLIEINPRLWGSLALSVFAGVDFPHLLYQFATTGVEPQLEYRVGVQARRLFGDVAQLLQRDDTMTAVAEFLTPSTAPRSYDVLSARDPFPFVGYASQRGAEFVENRLRSVRQTGSVAGTVQSTYS